MSPFFDYSLKVIKNSDPLTVFIPLVLITLVVSVFFIGSASGLMQEITLNELVVGSDMIVIGTVDHSTCQWNSDQTHILTTTYVSVSDTLKGSPESNPLSITTMGGTMGEISEWVEDQPVLVPGMKVGLFLNKISAGQYTVSGLYQGVYLLEYNRKGNGNAGSGISNLAVTDRFTQQVESILAGAPLEIPQTITEQLTDGVTSGSPVISSVSPTIASAGTESIITITGTGFGTKASRESNADVGFLYRLTSDGNLWMIYASGYPYFTQNANDIVSWTDTEIKVKVAAGYTSDGYSGSASSGFLRVYTDAGTSSEVKPFTVTFGYGKKKWQAPASYYINPGSVSGATGAIQTAGNTWNAQSYGSSFRFNNAGTTSSTVFGRNGQSLIFFGPAYDFSSSPNTIAWASSWTSSGNIVEADVEFNSGFSWTTGTATGNQVNVETIVLHEMGHWLCLKDLYGWLPEYNSAYSMYPSDLSPERKVMFGYNGQSMGNQNLKTLSSADIAGIQWIYPALNPVVNFGADMTSGTAPLTVQFTDTSTRTPTTWNWSFGDGELSSVKNPVHVYSAAGTYSVTLNASNSYGFNVMTKSNFITVNAPAPPVADFTGTPTSGTTPLTVRFTDASTRSPISWNWVFGDGSSVNATVQNPVHTYAKAGTYTVSLSVTNAGGTNTKTIADYIAVSPAKVMPVANFLGSPSSGNAPHTVRFNDTSTGSPTSWKWSFGDGNSSTLQNTVHTYTFNGSFTVSLNVTNNDGSNVTVRSNYIFVNVPKTIPNFIVNVTSGITPLPVSFTDLSLNNPDGWAWYFGDENFNTPWTQMNASAGWSGRYAHSSVVMPDGSIVLMGGCEGGWYTNDVWRSTDAGVTWTCINARAGWSARAYQSSVALPDGSIVLMGGWDLSSYQNDVWRSTDYGMTWTEVNESAGWTGRDRHSSVVMPDGSIVLMGGESMGNQYKNDVWRSTDNGVTWMQMNASAKWAGRWGHSSVVMPDGSIVLTGGCTGSNYQNDTWRSTDSGAVWTRLNASSGWMARGGHSSVVMPDGSIVLIGGADGGYNNDVWRSVDNGSTWTLVNKSAGWTGRLFHSCVVMPDSQVVLTGGITGSGNWNDVWHFMPAGSTDQNPTHTYTKPGIYSVALQAYNDGGYNSTRKTSYLYVTRPPDPVADFTANVTDGTAPLTVGYSDISTGYPTSWNWSFGDNSLSTTRNPVHAYTTPNNYTVSLTVENSDLISNTTERVRYLIVFPRGDLNHNWQVDTGDVARVAYMVVNRAPCSTPDADFNNNNMVDIGDAAKISWFKVGKISEL
ncbi:MAG: PKD domain-containing protein [Methanoregula sp.]|jgi:PKD repeat protein|nr:PKD domain-containing protein [Methanoregula sp.]